MRLDHLLSKERLESFIVVLCGGGGVRRSQPIARAFVPRWVLMGGISMNRCRSLVLAGSSTPGGFFVVLLSVFLSGGVGGGVGGGAVGLERVGRWWW